MNVNSAPGLVLNRTDRYGITWFFVLRRRAR
jgi:hypothetical protein